MSERSKPVTESKKTMLPGTATVKQWFEKPDFGLLLFRFSLGGCLLVYSIHCFRNLRILKTLGGAAVALHFPFSDTFWGIMAAFTFLWTGFSTLLGFYFRLAMAALFAMMLICCWERISWTFLFSPPYQPSRVLLIVSFVFLFIGPGRFSVKP
jgi:uncharacterized membrane protein YphA (DoxX/SURF4 family)